MFKNILVTFAVAATALAYPSLSPRVSACGKDLPAGLPDACYNNDVDCQYGIISKGTTIHDRGVINSDGSVQPAGSLVASPGSKVYFSWEPGPCYSDHKYSIIVFPNGSQVANILNPTGVLVGGTLINLGGSAKNSTEYLQPSGEGLVDGQNYIAALVEYNITTGDLIGWAGNVYFSWKA